MKTFKFTTGDSRSLAIHLIVNGRRVRVHIEPPVAYGFIDKAYYITNDEKIAEALKKHPNYGFLFHLESEVDDTPKVTEVVVKPEDLLTDAENAIYEESVTSKAKAVAYIQGMYDESFTSTSVEEMKKEAAKRWNIIFVNWK
jgi:hypothetical protein